MSFRSTAAHLVGLKRIEILLALIFGVLFGLAVHAFVLIGRFPLTGKRLPTLTLLAALIGAAAYFLLFRWLRPRLRAVSARRTTFLLLLGLLLSLFLSYTSSTGWTETNRYPSLLLHSNRVQIEAVSGANITVQWMKTSLEEISYNSASFHGWERRDDLLVLTDPANNAIEWQGKTGDLFTVVFQRPEQPAAVRLTLNGAAEMVNLPNIGGKSIIIERRMPVPFYGSLTAAKIYLVLSLAPFFFALLVFLSRYEREIAGLYQRGTLKLPANSALDIRESGAFLETWEWAAIFGFFAFALLLRIFKLDNLFPYIDEYSHMMAAKAILNGSSPFSVYGRSLYMVTLPVVLSFKLFGASVWAARLPGVIVNSLAILPLYLLARKINRPTALLAVFLYATNPWIIAVARNVREYAYYPFWFFLIVYAMLLVLEHLPGQLVLDKHFLKQINARWLVPLLLLALPVGYGMYIDKLSTFKVVFLAYAVFAVFLLAKLDFKNRANYLPLAGMAAAATLFAVVYLRGQANFVSQDLDVYTPPLSLFYPNPDQQWYFNRVNLIFLLAIFCAVFMAVWQYRHNPVPLFFTALTAAFLAFFALIFARYFRPRYIFSTELWYTVTIAFGLYVLWIVLQAFVPRKVYQAGIAAAALFVSINPQQVLLPTFYDSGGIMPVTAEYHYDLGTVDQYIREAFQPGDALAGTVYNNYVRFTGRPEFHAIKTYDYYNPKALDDLLPFIQQNPTGWLVIDRRLYYYSPQRPPVKTFDIGGARLNFAGKFYDQFVWHWQPLSGSGQ